MSKKIYDGFAGEDRRLLEVYWKGWDECFDNNDHSEDFNGLERTAYILGWDHYIIGDDVRSVDYLTGEEILEIIRKPRR